MIHPTPACKVVSRFHLLVPVYLDYTTTSKALCQSCNMEDRPLDSNILDLVSLQKLHEKQGVR